MRCSVSLQLDRPWQTDIHGRPTLSEEKQEEEWMVEVGRGGPERRRKRGNVGWDIKTKKIINSQKYF